MSTKGTADTAATSACSDGPARPEETVFANEPDEASHPTCTPRCGESGPYTTRALPSGRCETAGERCSMLVNHVCSSGSVGRVDAMTCTCDGGEWSCGVVQQGAGVCGPADGGR